MASASSSGDIPFADFKRSFVPDDVQQPNGTQANITPPAAGAHIDGPNATAPAPRTKQRRRRNTQQRQQQEEEDEAAKRRCVSTACIACRKRKSKCDGNTPACAACSQVYGTECIYDPNSDHRRKGVYRHDLDNLKTREATLQTLVQAILNYPEEDVPALIREIRTCESLDVVAERIVAKENGQLDEDEEDMDTGSHGVPDAATETFESHLYGKMGDLRLDDGSVRYIGGTSNLIHLAQEQSAVSDVDDYLQQDTPVTSWTTVTNDPELVLHLLNMYFTWHYTFFTTLSKQLFYRDFSLGRPPPTARRKTHYCTPLLVNAMLALGCHFTSHTGARANPEDSATAGDHFFREAKRLIMENDEHEKPHLTTVQALALMSVREAGCGREAKGWVYSGMSFRMACDMGLHLDAGHLTSNKYVSGDENEEDVRKVTFWGCYLFDKCWSNYMGRLPQLPSSLLSVGKYEAFPEEESSQWIPYTDSGFSQPHAQPARTRAVALQICRLCEISNDLMKYFYDPTDMEKTKGKAAELKKLSDIHTRLEAWRRDLPKEMEPKEGGLSGVLVMHMFFQLLFIHLFRPFLKYNQATSPLPHTVSPRKLCTQAATMISKLMRLYKRSHGLRQIPNIAVYISHSACTIHLLNLPDKNARRDIIHGIKHLEEIAEGWLCARRSLAIFSVLASKWKVELPEEAAAVLARTDCKFGAYMEEIHSPSGQERASEVRAMHEAPPQLPVQQYAPANLRQSPASYVTSNAVAQQQQPQYPARPQTQSSAPDMHSRSGSSYNASAPNVYNMQSQPPPQSQASNSHTSAAPQQRWTRPDGKTGGSPSDMFGGVEQLIRDSQEWAYRDQDQLATGFENWNPMNMYMDVNSWTTSPVAGGASMSMSTNGPRVPQPISQPNGGSLMPSTNGASYASMAGTVEGLDAVSMANWLDSMNAFNNLAASYNEDEWYQ